MDQPSCEDDRGTDKKIHRVGMVCDRNLASLASSPLLVTTNQIMKVLFMFTRTNSTTTYYSRNEAPILHLSSINRHHSINNCLA